MNYEIVPEALNKKGSCVKEHKYTLTIVIPYYNGKKFIERAIKSVNNQTIMASELIVVNDGSKEDEKAYLYGLKDQYDFKIIDKENGGQGDARNVGVNNATTNFVCFLDQDDFYKMNHNEILLAAIPPEPNNMGFIYADISEADGDGNIISTSMVKDHSSHPKVTVMECLRRDMFILPSASLIKVSAFKSVGGFDTSFTGYEDDDLFLRLFRAGYEHIFLDQPVTVWCIHTESTSYSVKMSKSRMKYLIKLMQMFPDEPARGRYYFRELLIPRFQHLVINDYITAIKNNSKNKDELEKLFLNYYKMVISNLHVSKKEKLKLGVFMLMACHFPKRLFLIILRFR